MQAWALAWALPEPRVRLDNAWEAQAVPEESMWESVATAADGRSLAWMTADQPGSRWISALMFDLPAQPAQDPGRRERSPRSPRPLSSRT